MIIIVLYFLAPVIQIVFNILRIKGGTRMPIGGIMMTAFILGLVCSFLAMTTLPVPQQTTPMPRCGMPEFAIFMGGFVLQITSAPLIAIVCYIVFLQRKRRIKNYLPGN
jgi:hypothetical protein